MAAKQLSVMKELYDMTECSICTEVFTDPRVLPCQHTFCLKCLVNYDKDRSPGDGMRCPLCRKEFIIPHDGLSGMQKNFLMEKLLSARKLSAAEEAGSILCDPFNESAQILIPNNPYEPAVPTNDKNLVQIVQGIRPREAFLFSNFGKIFILRAHTPPLHGLG